MIKYFAKLSILFIIFIIFSACTHKYIQKRPNIPNKVYDEKNTLTNTSNDIQVTKEYIKLARDKQDNITNQYTLEDTINSLATQMMRNQKFRTIKPVIVTSFVRLAQLKKTTEFGRVVSESLINELSNRGLNIVEFRGQLAVSINEEGEYFISRKTRELKKNIPDTYVVVGTYSRQRGKIILNSRVIDNITGRIITSARATFIHRLINDCSLFKDCQPPRTIRIIQE